MRKFLASTLVLSALLGVSLAVRSTAMCGHCGDEGKAHKHEAGHAEKHKHEHAAACPMHVEGAEVSIKNTETGVTIEITSKDPETAKKIQLAAAKKKEYGHKCEDCGHHKKGKGAKKG